MPRTPLISTIVCTFNRAEFLPRVLDALAAQTLDQGLFEVVVVDDGSSDGTREAIERYMGIPNLRYVLQRNSGLAAAKNHGLFLARAPIVLFLDDDDIADPHLLEEHLSSHRQYPATHHAVLGHTDLTPEIAADPLMDFVTGAGGQLFSYSFIHKNVELNYEYFWGGRSSCKREFLLHRGIFDPVFRFGCEDIELGYRLSAYGLTISYEPKARSKMIRCLTFDQFLRRTRLQGGSQYVFSQKHLVSEILDYTKVVNAEPRWQQLEPVADAIFCSARKLDAFVRGCKQEALAQDPALKLALHAAYRRAFETANLQGIVINMRKQRSLMEQHAI